MPTLRGQPSWLTRAIADGKAVVRHAKPPVAPPVDEIGEAEFQAAVIAEAKRCGWKHYHTRNSRKSVAGFPDLVLVGRRVIFAELKAESGRLTADQLGWLEALRDAGAEVYTWRPSDWATILKTLTEN